MAVLLLVGCDVDRFLPPHKARVEATLSEDVRTVQFPVDTRKLPTSAEIAEMAAVVGVDHEGREQYHGVTHCRIEVHEHVERRLDGCTLRVGVTVSVLILVADWPGRARADAVSARAWDAYLGDMMTHENIHRDLRLDAARQLRDQIAAVEVSPKCEAGPAIQALRDAALKQLSEVDTAYDTLTDHGAHQDRWTGSPKIYLPAAASE